MQGADVPWCVVGGWAIELFLGRAHRHHEDIEVAVPRSCFSVVREHLAGYRFHTAGDGEVRELRDGEEPSSTRHQHWLLDREANAWRMDLMLEPGDVETWVFRRDERITAPRSRMIGRRSAVPYLRPEGVLLYKAKLCREKDEVDFTACLPVMDARARAWLARALELVHPRHAWLDPLRLTRQGQGR